MRKFIFRALASIYGRIYFIVNKITGPRLAADFFSMGVLGYFKQLIVRHSSARPNTVVTVHGYEMHTGTAPVQLTNFLYGVNDNEVVDLFIAIVKKGMKVVDIGAHIGYFTLLLAKLVGPTGKVYAFEPQRDCFELLTRNIALNKYDNVEVVRKAISDKTGHQNFYYASIAGGAGFWSSAESNTNCEIVESTTLDDFFREKEWPPSIDLVKIDIEGEEPAAIEGMRDFLRENTKPLKMIIEFSPVTLKTAGIDPEIYLGRLKEIGLQVYLIKDKGRVEALNLARLPQWTPTRGYYANLFCEKTR